MKIKSDLKSFVLIALLLTICVFSTNKVKAATIDEIKNAIPSEITVNVKESEFQKLFGTEGVIYKTLTDELGIDLDGYEYSAYTVGNDSENIDIHNFGINLSNGNDEHISKQFRVIYSNTSDYNESDKQKVEKYMEKNRSYFWYEPKNGDDKINFDTWDYVEQEY